jgi:hypothetical protein
MIIGRIVGKVPQTTPHRYHPLDSNPFLPLDCNIDRMTSILTKNEQMEESVMLLVNKKRCKLFFPTFANT